MTSNKDLKNFNISLQFLYELSISSDSNLFNFKNGNDEINEERLLNMYFPAPYPAYDILLISSFLNPFSFLIMFLY